MNPPSKTRRCHECSGAGTQLYGLAGDVRRSTCVKCGGVGHFIVKSRNVEQLARAAATRAANRQAFADARIAERARGLDDAVKDLREAMVWRDRSLDPSVRPQIRRALRSAMRSHALDSRRAFLGQIRYAGPDPRDLLPLPIPAGAH